MFFKSIRFRLLLWYMLFLTVTLLAFSSVLYGIFDKNLLDDFEDLLSSRAEGVANSINAYYHTKTADPGGFVSIAKDWVEEKRKDPDLMSLFVRILNEKGEVLVASKSTPAIAHMTRDDWDDILGGEDSFDLVSGETANGSKARFRVYTKPVMLAEGKVSYVVQVVGPAELVWVALKNLIFVIITLLPITIVLAGIPSIILVRLTLKPVDKMINTLKQITTENLKLKIHMPDTKDEIKKLADTFNDMIERLDKSFSSQQRFIQDIYNELKTPMGVLREDIRSVLSEKYSAEDYKSLMARIAKEADDFSDVIEDLLTLSRFDNNQVTLEIRKVNLGHMIDSVLKDMGSFFDEKAISISSACPKQLVIDGDEAQLKRLFLNILDNAVKYTYRNGSIKITARKNKRMAQVDIGDTGIGIDDEDLPYIFDRFYQAAKSRVSRGSFGLGLSTAKSIADAHHATISVESQQGKGSTFTVLLPLSYPG